MKYSFATLALAATALATTVNIDVEGSELSTEQHDRHHNNGKSRHWMNKHHHHQHHHNEKHHHRGNHHSRGWLSALFGGNDGDDNRDGGNGNDNPGLDELLEDLFMVNYECIKKTGLKDENDFENCYRNRAQDINDDLIRRDDEIFGNDQDDEDEDDGVHTDDMHRRNRHHHRNHRNHRHSRNRDEDEDEDEEVNIENNRHHRHHGGHRHSRNQRHHNRHNNHRYMDEDCDSEGEFTDTEQSVLSSGHGRHKNHGRHGRHGGHRGQEEYSCRLQLPDPAFADQMTRECCEGQADGRYNPMEQTCERIEGSKEKERFQTCAYEHGAMVAECWRDEGRE